MNEERERFIFGKNLTYYVDRSGKEQKIIAKDLGFAPTTFNTWCKGKIIPSMGKVQKIADYFGIGKTDLLDEKIQIDTVPIDSGAIIPVLGRVCAGNGTEAIEEQIDSIEISPKMAQKGSHFGLIVSGDSMSPLLSDGDIVIVNRDAEVDSGDLVVALVDGSDAMCKRFQKYSEGFALIPENPTYEPMRCTKEDIDKIPVKILGKVVESRRRY